MLVAIWIITFCLIIGIGVYAGTKIKSANQWSGGDKTMGALTLGCVFAAWQIGGMAVVGAAQNGYNLGISGSWYSIAGSFYFIALAVFAKIIRERMTGESVPVYLQTRYDIRTTRLYSYAWIVYGFLYIPIQLKTVSSIIQIVLPGLNIMAAMFIGVTIAVIYTSFSGMKGASAVGRVVCIGIYVLLICLRRCLDSEVLVDSLSLFRRTMIRWEICRRSALLHGLWEGVSAQRSCRRFFSRFFLQRVRKQRERVLFSAI